MTSKQEIIDAMNREHEGTPPPALFSQTATFGQMDACGAGWPEANFDAEKMAELALQASRMFGFATVRIPFDITAEAERLGCTIDRDAKGRQPAVIDTPWKTEDVGEPPELMPVDEFIEGGRCAMHIEVTRRLSKEHPELFLTSCMIGPGGVAGYLMGMENFMIASFMDPEATAKWVAAVTPYQCEYAKALSEASDNVFMITGGAEEIASPDMFDLFNGFESKVFACMKDSFSVAHCCGTTSKVLEKLAAMGSNALSVESHDDPQSIADRIGDKVVLVGGVDPVGTLMQGTPEEVRKSAWRAADAGYCLITPECGVPPVTPNENLLALSRYRDA
ncbi:MAG: hypothetical protein IKH98_06540 [Candidatus Methanomethylophilaceae archaeon]|nr:hypothetical protein [Candidatus Methanomethylophilaceae archaeon]